VTDAILSKQFSLATTLKQEIEQKQRDAAADREKRGIEWKPRFFTGAVTPVGKPDLTKEGEEVLKGMQKEEYDLAEPTVYGAM
jgi:oxysterol-binding protein-related protein 9/10/11